MKEKVQSDRWPQAMAKPQSHLVTGDSQSCEQFTCQVKAQLLQ